MQSRRTEVVLMRSLGTSRAACVLVMLFEYASLGLLGALFGMLCAVIFAGFAGAAPLLAFLMFFASFVLGAAGAAFQISRRTAMSGLVKVEA
jgi:predicted lysophospholipase L1 biosynthesis ABC-type transport system permease subunit